MGEFLEFELNGNSLRYANNSNYRSDSLIRKEMWLSPMAVAEFKRIVEQSEITKEDDGNWPQKSVVGKQELEVRLGKTHISFETAKIGSLVDVQNSGTLKGFACFTTSSRTSGCSCSRSFRCTSRSSRHLKWARP